MLRRLLACRGAESSATARRWTVFSSTASRQCEKDTRPPVTEADRQRQSLEAEAAQKGFFRRDSVDSTLYMEETFTPKEQLDSGVQVVNLPPAVREKTQFDLYRRSTRDYTSQVTPHGIVGVGLGAGFGVKEDKRLGFLRPQKIQPMSMDPGLTPKYDENGMPIDETLSRKEQMKRRLKYLKSFDGTTMSHREHFLLVDLDFEKDAVLFGNTREEFEANVAKMRNVILNYQKWERTDNFYYYSTIVLKVLTAWVLMECFNQQYEYRLLSASYNDFAMITEEEMEQLGKQRERDFARAYEELRVNRPDFAPVIEAIRLEKHRCEAAKLAAREKEEEEARVAAEVAEAVRAAQAAVASVVSNEGEEGASAMNSVAPLSGVAVLGATFAAQGVIASSAKALGDTPTAIAGFKAHPMDTSRDEEVRRATELEETRRQMARLKASVSAEQNFSLWTSIKWWVLGKASSGGGMQPLLQEDYVNYSYAASPTSIGSIRALRRVLLPRSEDFTQIVREEMLEYRMEKEAQITCPG